MFNIPDTEKKIKARISSYRSSMRKEQKAHGFISDGAGKRYLLFWLYLACGELTKFDEYVSWYEENFSDDIGEPGQKLCLAVGLHRLGKDREAKKVLADLMLMNLYIIPQVLGDSYEDYDIWRFSNYSDSDYFDYFSEDMLNLISEDDLAWLREQYESDVFQRMKEMHIEIYVQLKNVKDVDKRRGLLGKAYRIVDILEEERN
jgi:hypothetical protein